MDAILLDDIQLAITSPQLDLTGYGTTTAHCAAVVQMLHPGGAKSFQDYVDKVFTSFILSQLQKANRIDVVWDVYISYSLKAVTGEREEECSKQGHNSPIKMEGFLFYE